MSVSDVPLLNQYKSEFVKKRLPQTFFGGLNVRLGYKAPCYVYTFQILVWIFPWIVGGIFTVATEIGGLSILIGSLLSGAIAAILVLIVQILHIFSSKPSTVTDKKDDLTASQQLHHLLAEDDEIDFDSPCSFTTFKFIFPPLRFRPGILYHVLFTAILNGCGYWYTLPTLLNNLYANNTAVVVVIYVFSWITICIAQFPLNSGGIPPEVATFRSVDLYDFASLSRAFHLFLFFVFHIVEAYFPSFQAVNQVLHIVFLFLPFLWISGLLPPIDAFCLWICEQVLVFGLGGSPCATDVRLLVSLLLSGAVLLGASFMPSVNSLFSFAIGFGFLLSTDIISLLSVLTVKLMRRRSSEDKRSSQQSYPHGSTHFSVANFSLHLVVVVLIVVTVAVTSVFRLEAINNVNTDIALEITMLVLFVASKLLQDGQKVYIFFRFFRNSVYPLDYTQINNSIKTRQTVLKVFGYTYMTLTAIVNPIVMTAYLSLFIFLTDSGLPSFLTAVEVIHACRMIWQRSNHSLLALVIVSIYRLVSGATLVEIAFFEDSTLGQQLLLLDICLDRGYRFLGNLWFVGTLLITSWTDKKQRRDSSLCLLITNILLFPVVLGVVALASALSAPVLPLFTLPVFFVAFPRPSRFWSQTPGAAPASVCADTSHYEKMAPGLVRSIAKGVATGKYAKTTAQGTDMPFFIARSQDKTFWIQTLESGFGYSSWSVKGLELQETSCHALEATRLDDACQSAFEAPPRPTCVRTNPYSFLYAVTPIHTEHVDGYSDAKNSLSGIIDYPDAIKQLHVDFMKSLVWLMVHLLSKKNRVPSSELQVTNESSAKTGRKASSRNGADVTDPSNPGGKIANGKNQTSTFMLSQDLHKASPSLDSLGSILASGSEKSRRKSKNFMSPKKPSALPGAIGTSDDLWELDSDLSDSGFGMPGRNIFAKQPTIKQQDAFQNGLLSPISNNHSKANAKDVTGWGVTPFDENELKPYVKLFHQSWYLHVTSVVDDVEWGQEEDLFLVACREVALACYMIVFVQGVPGRDPSSVGAGHISKVFSGNIPWSPDLDWMTERTDLCEIVLQAFRYSVKMMYDRVAMGAVDDAASEPHDETVTSLQEYDNSWYIGPENSSGWKKAVKNGIPSLFGISFDSAKNEHSARVLLRRSVETHVCRISSASVRSIWANLSLELLYATNDDEERYSIQAHPNLLRNLTTQAADPPLGYPIYSSSPFYAPTLPAS